MSKRRKEPVTYSEVFRYLSSKEKYDEKCAGSKKRAIRKFAECVELQDGVLHYLQYEDRKAAKKERKVKYRRQWIHDDTTKKHILQSLHDNPMGGSHFGRDKTRSKVVKRYYWHGMYDEIDNYVKTCVRCQKVSL